MTRPFETPAFDQTPARGFLDADHPSPVTSASKRRKISDDDEVSSSGDASTGGGSDSLPLDAFITRYTSEDNASFSEIMEKNQQKAKERYWWYYNQARRGDAATQEAAEQKLLTGSSSTALIMWPHDPKNPLMFTPDGVVAPHLAEAAAAKIITHANTRFTAEDLAAMDPERRQKSMEEEALRKKALEERSALAARDPHSIFSDPLRAEKNKRIDLDDLLGTPRPAVPDSPRVRGYGFVSTPSPMIGRDGVSPFMTWGDIEGSPLALDPLMDELTTPLDVAPTAGPEFKVPERSAREQIAIKLADDVLKKKKAEEAVIQARKQKMFASSPAASPRASPMIQRTPEHFSPAARALAERMRATGGGSDSQLRSSYRSGASPASKPGRSTPSASPFASPTVGKRKAPTPSIISSTSSQQQQKSSLTDGLLKS